MSAPDQTLPNPIDVLPHRDPFLFVDEITAITPGESASGLWRLTGDEAFFAGHFPVGPRSRVCCNARRSPRSGRSRC